MYEEKSDYMIVTVFELIIHKLNKWQSGSDIGHPAEDDGETQHLYYALTQ